MASGNGFLVLCGESFPYPLLRPWEILSNVVWNKTCQTWNYIVNSAFFHGIIARVRLVINHNSPCLQGTDYTKSTQIALGEVRFHYMGKGAKGKTILKVVYPVGMYACNGIEGAKIYNLSIIDITAISAIIPTTWYLKISISCYRRVTSQMMWK